MCGFFRVSERVGQQGCDLRLTLLFGVKPRDEEFLRVRSGPVGWVCYCCCYAADEAAYPLSMRHHCDRVRARALGYTCYGPHAHSEAKRHSSGRVVC